MSAVVDSNRPAQPAPATALRVSLPDAYLLARVLGSMHPVAMRQLMGLDAQAAEAAIARLRAQLIAVHL